MLNDAVLFESVPNFSEGRRHDVIDLIARAASAAHLLDTDFDPDHNRVVVSLAGTGSELTAALLAAVAEAARHIDVRGHTGVHPRVGAADVVPIVPLGASTLEGSRELAQEIGRRIWSELRLPVFFYGYGTRRSLADIRNGRVRPDLGADARPVAAGAVCVGARPVLIAFNVTLPGLDLPAGRRLARAVRESSGGMRGVQALAFELPGGRVQLSMNLVRPDLTRPGDVVAELQARGVEVGEQQLVGLCPAAFGGQFAAGRLLEARLAAAAARAGADRCRRKGGDELAALAHRLDQEAASLRDLGVDQESLLAGAERAAALAPVLRVAQALDAELEAMLNAAARSLRSALSPETAAAYPARLSALDRRLGPG